MSDNATGEDSLKYNGQWWRTDGVIRQPLSMKVYVNWYNDIKEGELLKEEYSIGDFKMKQVLINIDKHFVIALYTPQHIYYDQRREKSMVP